MVHADLCTFCCDALACRRVPSGLPYASVNAHMQRLDVNFLSRFLFEILRYINLLMAMQPPPLSDAPNDDTPEPVRDTKQKKGKQVVFPFLFLDSLILLRQKIVPLRSSSCRLSGRKLW